MKKFIENNLWGSSVAIAIGVAYLIGLLSVYFFKEYGWTVFVLVPFLLGLLPTLIHSSIQALTTKQSLKLGLTTLGIFCFTTLLFALEGIICIIMASPILALFTMIGSVIGTAIVENYGSSSKQLYSIVLLPIIFIMMDVSIDSKEYLAVKTTIEIAAPIDKVWNQIVSFGTIEEPDEWLFKTGIAYPTDSKIKGRGVGAVRYCNFTTGSFVEPITVWEAPPY